VLVVQLWLLCLVYTHPGARYVYHQWVGKNLNVSSLLIFWKDLNVKIVCLVL
jgi:hypothetical protein